MSTTPAFSPGPCTTNFPRVGSRFRCTLLDLYEQCSLHITLKMPSSVMFGSRPRICFTRAYSSAVNPCSAAISGVTLISVGAVAICAPKRKKVWQAASLLETIVRETSSAGSRCANQRFHHRAENDQPVGGSQRRFHRALGMRHQSGDVAFPVADARNVVQRTIRIARRIVRSVRCGVAKNYPPGFLQFRKRAFVDGVVAFVVRDGDPQDLSLLRGIGER